MTQKLPATELTRKHCRPCEGDSLAYDAGSVKEQMLELPLWSLDAEGKWISRIVLFIDFDLALKFLNAVAELAQTEGHHPDLHLIRYREVKVDLTTHSIEGLSENDFIVAAKVDELIATTFTDAKVSR